MTIVLNSYTIAAATFAALVLVIVAALLLRSLRKRLGRRRPSPVITQQIKPQRQRNTPGLLRAWADYAFETQEVAQWLKDLDRKQMRSLVDEMMDFGARFGFDPNWVLEARVEVDAELNATLSKSMEDWVNSRYQAAQAQDRVIVFQRYQQLIEKPNAGDNLALAQALYTRLVEANLTPQPPADLILSTDKARQNYTVEQIQSAAKKDWASFSAILLSLMNDAQGVSPGRRRRLRRRAEQQINTGTVPAPANA